MEKLILYYNSKKYFISQYDTELMMRYEKPDLIERWTRRISHELNISRKNLFISFVTLMELCGSWLKPYITIKYSERKCEKVSSICNKSKLKITLQ